MRELLLYLISDDRPFCQVRPAESTLSFGGWWCRGRAGRDGRRWVGVASFRGPTTHEAATLAALLKVAYLIICISKQGANNFKVSTPMRPDAGMGMCATVCVQVCVCLHLHSSVDVRLYITAVHHKKLINYMYQLIKVQNIRPTVPTMVMEDNTLVLVYV